MCNAYHFATNSEGKCQKFIQTEAEAVAHRILCLNLIFCKNRPHF